MSPGALSYVDSSAVEGLDVDGARHTKGNFTPRTSRDARNVVPPLLPCVVSADSRCGDRTRRSPPGPRPKGDRVPRPYNYSP